MLPRGTEEEGHERRGTLIITNYVKCTRYNKYYVRTYVHSTYVLVHSTGQGYKWTNYLCRLDSDSDGQSNGLELGDPDCAWAQQAGWAGGWHARTHANLAPNWFQKKCSLGWVGQAGATAERCEPRAPWCDRPRPHDVPTCGCGCGRRGRRGSI